ncbi:MAG: enoyl-CoA hydratase [Frankiales bacterium]|nr:enoyl-CoA hydratase [Frankiales bacterium]
MTTTERGTVSVTVDADGIAVVTLRRPEQLNAFTLGMRDDLLAAFDQTDGDDDVRAVVVTGSGRAFCAGADLSSGGDTFDYASHDRPDPDVEAYGVHRDDGGLVTLRIFESLKPVLAAVNGPAVGIGASMTLAMDARFAATGAKVGFVFARRGLVPDACASWFLPRLVGIPTALEWCYSGRVFGSEEGLAAGLFSAVHEPSELLDRTKAAALRMVSASAPVSLALTRQLIWRMAGAAHPMDAHRADSRALQIQGASGDVREGVTAFLDKREPRFPRKVSRDLPDTSDWWEQPPFA